MFEFTLPAIITSISLLLIRLIVGFAFLVAAKNKAANIRKFAKGNDLPVPVARIVVLAEASFGVAVLLGILTQLAAAGIMLLMASTIFLHTLKWKSPYWAAKGGWEYDLMLLAFASVLLIHGGGEYSLLN